MSSGMPPRQPPRSPFADRSVDDVVIEVADQGLRPSRRATRRRQRVDRNARTRRRVWRFADRHQAPGRPTGFVVSSHSSRHRTTVIRVVVADDHELVRDGIARILEAQPDIDIVGTAADGIEAVDLIRAAAPDVALMDIQMPKLDGVEATRRLVAAGTTTRIVILTTFGHDDNVLGALRAGASGFLLKDTPKAALISGVRAVAAGDATLDSSVMRRLIDDHLAPAADATPLPGPSPADDTRDPSPQTPGAGNSNEEIATSLHLSQSTVKTHVPRPHQGRRPRPYPPRRPSPPARPGLDREPSRSPADRAEKRPTARVRRGLRRAASRPEGAWSSRYATAAGQGQGAIDPIAEQDEPG